MKHRGALILVPDFPAHGGGGSPWAAFGECDLLGLTVRAVRPATPHIVIVPAGAPFSRRYARQFGDGVLFGPPVGGSTPEREALKSAEAMLVEGVSEILRVEADLPYLTEGFIENMFRALAPEVEQVLVVEGERRPPAPVVYRRAGEAAGDDTGDDTRNNTRNNTVEGAAHRQPRRVFLPAEPAGPAGATVVTRLDSPDGYRLALAHHGLCDSSEPAVTLELFGNLRIKTGCERLPIFSATIREAFDVLRRVHPLAGSLLPEASQLPEHFRFSINGAEVTTDLDHALKENDNLILFSATVGG